MRSHYFKWSRALVPSLLLLGPSLGAQSTSNSAESDDDVVRLDPFTVSGDDAEGYAAKCTTSGLGFSVDTENLPIPITVLTSKFFEDSGSIKVEDAVRYASGAGIGGRTMKSERDGISASDPLFQARHHFPSFDPTRSSPSLVDATPRVQKSLNRKPAL